MAEAFDRQTEITSYLSRMREALAKVSTTDLTWLAETFEQAYLAGRTLFVCGNGGSAATASHLAVDLSKNTRTTGRPPVRTVSLVDHVPALTAWANDFGYDQVFAGQLAGLAQPGDLVVGISTSGNSPNVLEALRYGRAHGMITVGLLGPDGGLARELCDAYVLAPADSIEEQEDIHMSLAHILTRHMRAFVHASHPELTGATTAQVR
ncbi:phosphoheptose isomerase [Streptomyces hygroscopicus subsp. hygroscopicus]|nr:SIS domain-containing protein [Streptomyces hygroscopicus]GLX50934.1 phosphoheptose isomerase [Streptomyces hygroscopicus subsp. hygroscopicus]